MAASIGNGDFILDQLPHSTRFTLFSNFLFKPFLKTHKGLLFDIDRRLHLFLSKDISQFELPTLRIIERVLARGASSSPDLIERIAIISKVVIDNDYQYLAAV